MNNTIITIPTQITPENIGPCHLDHTAYNGLRMICDEYDILNDTPDTGITYGTMITSLIIQNQPRFNHLSQMFMLKFPALIELKITNTGLNSIEYESFINNKYLKKVDLSSNALAILDWRSVIGLREATLDLSDNPLICNCSIFWLSVWRSELTKKRPFTSPDGTIFFISTADAMTMPKEIINIDFLQCRQTRDHALIHLNAWRFAVIQNSNTCSLPTVQLSPKVITVSKSHNNDIPIIFNCTIHSNLPLDTDFRQPFQLKVVNANETKHKMRIQKSLSSNGQSILELKLINIFQNQMGWYVCLGLSKSGPNFDMATLLVESEPSIRLGSRNRSKSVDHIKETFEFMIYSYPTPLNFTWLKNDQPIDFMDDANKHAFLTMDDESDYLKKRGFFYVFRITFVIKFRYSNSYFQGNYTLRVCNSLACTRLTFVNYTKNTLPTDGNYRLGSDDMILTGRISSVDQSSDSNRDLILIVIIIFVCVIILVCFLGVSYRFLKRKYRRDANYRKPIRSHLEPSSVQLNSYNSNSTYEPILCVTVPLIPRTSLELVKSLGEGAFGEVYLAYCDLSDLPNAHKAPNSNSSQNDQRSIVAAKVLKQMAFDRGEIAREAELMAKLDHPNIVTFYGVCLRNGQDLLLLYEYMELGDLKRFLILHGPHPELSQDTPVGEIERLSDHQLIDIAHQVALGLEYLHENHFVHRDLASRNCLVKSPLIVKLSDFGMTRDIYSCDYYRLSHTAPLPVRWLPPESLLYGRFSDTSDIYSFGVVLWEIASYGKQPWCEYSNVEVMQRVSAGEVLVPPMECPKVLREAMLECWKRTPSHRAKLSDVIRKFARA